jgi:DNA-binding Xre family transcriptional regulator
MRTVGYHWHLRTLMAQRGMFATTDLAPKLAERGIELHPTQVYRLVTGTPERLNLQILAALCDILTVTPAELIEPYAQTGTTARPRRKAVGAPNPTAAADPTARPKRARIVAEET